MYVNGDDLLYTSVDAARRQCSRCYWRRSICVLLKYGLLRKGYWVAYVAYTLNTRRKDIQYQED